MWHANDACPRLGVVEQRLGQCGLRRVWGCCCIIIGISCLILMNNISELKQELQNSIENLYKVFEKYELRPDMKYCDCGCISSEQFGFIFSNPLRLLNPDELERYSWKAMTTWGDSHDFRHFLPRLFELLTTESQLTTDTEIVFSKLTYGDWQTWDLAEQEVISEYFSARWKLILFQEPRDEYTKTDEILCGIGQAVNDVSPFLDIWKNLGSISS